MKPAAPLFDTAVDTSHARIARVDVLDPAGTLVDTLPVSAGQVTGTAGLVDRWSGSVTVPVSTGTGASWVPTSPAAPLSGFAGYSLVVHVGVIVDDVDLFVPVARLWPFTSRLTRSADTVELVVDLVGPAAYAQQAAGREHAALPGESCQAMMTRLLLGAVPHTPTVIDTTTPDPTPDDYTSDADVWSVVQDLAARADVAVFFDAAGDLVIREPLPTIPTAAERRLSARVNVTAYTVAVGRDLVANEVRARFRGTDGETDVVGVAQVTAGPLSVNGPAGRIVDTVDVDVVAGGQAKADRAAASILRAQLAAWATVEVDHVPDPRLEPDDVVQLEYLDGTVAHHRVVTVVVPLDATASQTFTARTATPPEE